MTEAPLLRLLPFRQASSWNIKQLFSGPGCGGIHPARPLSDALTRRREAVCLEDAAEYTRITIRTNCGGVVVRDRLPGAKIKTKHQYRIHAGQLAVSKIDARNGAFGAVPPEAEGAVITGNFWVYDLCPQIARLDYLVRLLACPRFVQVWEACSHGSGNRLYLQEAQFLRSPVPFPPLLEQQALAQAFAAAEGRAGELDAQADALEAQAERSLLEALGVAERPEAPSSTQHTLLQTARFRSLTQWGYDKVEGRFPFRFTTYPPVSLEQAPQLCLELFRGKSPRYDPQGTQVVLNQRCNRKNEIQLQYAKPVSAAWLKRIAPERFTMPGDLLINSTGEGTLGRASLVGREQSGLFLDSHLLLLRLRTDLVNPCFFAHLFNSRLIQCQVEQLKGAQATKQTELGVENVRRIRFPLPPLEIQQALGAQADREAIQARQLRAQAVQLRAQAQQAFETAVFGCETP